MDFELTEERRMLADSLTRYVAEQYGFAERMRISQQQGGFCPQQWARFAEMGTIGALFSEALGGYGGSGFDIALIFEALGRGLVLEPLLPSAILAGSAMAHAVAHATAHATSHAVAPAGQAPDTAAHHQLLSELISGQTLATLAHEEPGAHYELARVQTSARRDAHAWALDGAKAVVAMVEATQVLIVSARTSGAIDAPEGISLFVVPVNTTGLAIQHYPTIDGSHAADVRLTQVRLPLDALLGAEGQALPTLEHAIDRGLLALCAESLGAMEAAKQATIEYLQTRKQFGVPIGSFQALQHRMADLLLEIEQARSAVINATAALDADRLTRERALSAAKYSIGRIGTLVAEECIQLHGGIGMTWELPLSHYAKRLVMIDHQLGDEDHHLARYIALSQP